MHFPVAAAAQEHASRKLSLNPNPTRDPTDVEVLFGRVEMMKLKRVKATTVPANLASPTKVLARSQLKGNSSHLAVRISAPAPVKIGCIHPQPRLQEGNYGKPEY